MQETAVGIFSNAGVADAVVDSLRAHGIPSQDIRVITAPSGMAGDGFGNGFIQDMKAMGVSEFESKVYLEGLGRGSVMVFASGSRMQASEALTVMNEFGAMELDAFAGPNPSMGTKQSYGDAPITGNGDLGTINPEPKLPESNVTIGEHEHTYTSHASRSKTEGARIFTW